MIAVWRGRDLGVALGLWIGLSAAWAGEPPKPAEPYVPGLGDFMTAYVQPHHAKLILAGDAHNWPLAAYEAGELRETFEDVATAQGAWHDFPIAKRLESEMIPALDEVDRAIEAQDRQGFNAAAARMTAVCNACHVSTGHPFLVIRNPAFDDYPDQQFRVR